MRSVPMPPDANAPINAGRGMSMEERRRARRRWRRRTKHQRDTLRVAAELGVDLSDKIDWRSVYGYSMD